MMTESDVAELYIQILGRQADPSGLANAVAAVNGGATEAQIARGLATSAEAQARISGLYQSELGRAADGPGLANVTNALANGGSLAQVEQGIATSPEAQAAIARLYQAELGRSPDSGGAASFTRYLAGGGSLTGIAASLAGSPEAQARIGALYQNVLARAALPAELASSTQYLAGAGSLAGLRSVLATSTEAANAIQAAYTAAGVLPSEITVDDVQIAVGQSELLSGVGLTTLRGEIADDVPSFAIAPANVGSNVALVTPGKIGGQQNASTYFYSLGTNNALIAGQPEKVSFNYSYAGDVHALLGDATISGFNPATDLLQIAREQAYGLSGLTISPVNTPAGAGTSVGSFNAHITLLNVTPDALHASNFRFV